ncbi:hypothetical protein KXR53_07850 [Inquilinus limosus]|uniref:hypothetical protein n=1 Tax=Inquilinus limosus TaxID=171674 RepID=UPI003F13E014
MSLRIERSDRPFVSTSISGQQQAFQAALQRAASARPASLPAYVPEEPSTEAELIELLRSEIVMERNPEANEMGGAMALNQVMPFLEKQRPAERQATVLRLLEAFPKGGTSDATDTREAWVRNGIEYAATLAGLATDPAEAQRREGEEAFATQLFSRGNRLEYHPDETDDSAGAMADDIRAFLDETTRGGESASASKWGVLNRLYERDWVDAGPVMQAIEQVAAEDFGRELEPTSHKGAGTHAAAEAIHARAAAMGGYSETQEYGIPNQQFYDLAIGARYASPAAQQELAQKLSEERFALSSLSRFVTMPLDDPRRSLHEGGLEMFRRLEWLTRDMEGPLAAQVVGQSLNEMESLGGLPDPIDFTGWKGDSESFEGSALGNLHAVVNRIEGTTDGDAVITRMRDHGMIPD